MWFCKETRTEDNESFFSTEGELRFRPDSLEIRVSVEQKGQIRSYLLTYPLRSNTGTIWFVSCPSNTRGHATPHRDELNRVVIQFL